MTENTQTIEIARALSPAMVDALKTSYLNSSLSGRYLGGTVTQSTRRALADRGLVNGSFVILTELGVAVYTLLNSVDYATLTDADQGLPPRDPGLLKLVQEIREVSYSILKEGMTNDYPASQHAAHVILDTSVDELAFLVRPDFTIMYNWRNVSKTLTA